MAAEEEKKVNKEQKKKRKNYLVLFAIAVLIGAGAYYFINSRNINSSAPSENAEVSQSPITSSGELTSKKWTWVESQMSNDITTTPSEDGAFTATFQSDGRLVLTSDCNNGNAGYEVGENNSLTVTPIASTMMFCEGSAETAYFKQIQTADSYLIDNGQLWIILQGDTGTMIFE